MAGDPAISPGSAPSDKCTPPSPDPAPKIRSNKKSHYPSEMAGQNLLDRLKSKFGDKISGSNLQAIDPWIEVTPAGLVEVCQYLKTDPDLQFNLLRSEE